MERLLRLQDQIASGIAPDLPPEQVRLWIDGQDIVFKEGSIQPYPGYQRLLTNLQVSPVVGLLETRIAGRANLFWGSRSALYQYNSSAGVTLEGSGYTGIENATATQAVTSWSIVPWGQWVLATNGVNTPQIWKDSSPAFANLTGMNFATAEIFVRWRDFLLAFNTDDYPMGCEWSVSGNPESWVPALTNNAGNLTFRDLGSNVVAAAILGNNILAYGENRITNVSFVNAPYWFGQRPGIQGIGAVGKRSICAVGNYHFGFCSGGIFKTDGVGFVWIDRVDNGNPKATAGRAIHDYIFGDINTAQWSKVVAWYNRSLQLVLFSYPSADSLYNDKCVAYDPSGDYWTILSRVPNAGSDEGIFSFPVVGFRDGSIFIQDTVSTLPNAEGSPVLFDAEATLTFGYGEGGYGEGGYGGELVVTG